MSIISLQKAIKLSTKDIQANNFPQCQQQKTINRHPKANKTITTGKKRTMKKLTKNQTTQKKKSPILRPSKFGSNSHPKLLLSHL